jgi:hypothetical protein
MPVGRETLHPPEGRTRHVAHVLQCQPHDQPEHAIAQSGLGDAEHRHQRQRDQGRIERHRVAPAGDRGDEVAGEDRQKHIGQRGADHGAGGHADQAPVRAPLAQQKRQHSPHGPRATLYQRRHNKLRPERPASQIIGNGKETETGLTGGVKSAHHGGRAMFNDVNVRHITLLHWQPWQGSIVNREGGGCKAENSAAPASAIKRS